MRWRAVLYQQLSGKAAATIVGRVETALGSQRLHADTLGRVRTGNSIAQIERWTAGKRVESLGRSCCQRAFAGMPVCRRDLSAGATMRIVAPLGTVNDHAGLPIEAHRDTGDGNERTRPRLSARRSTRSSVSTLRTAGGPAARKVGTASPTRTCAIT